MGHIWLCVLFLLSIFLSYGHSLGAKPKPVLIVSPPWLSPGASVTLSCEVKESSADWRFYWSRAVPTPSNMSNSYTYKLLPGSQHGTVEGSYIIHGSTGTGGYVCNAGRGDPVYYTKDSEPQFVWSGDLHSSASLTVSSNRTQHFSSVSESVSLSCEGKYTEWKVKSYPERLLPASPSKGPMTRYTWKVRNYALTSGVYWCESGLGEYSNAVNITQHTGSVILVSPVLPVTKGHSVTLQCKHRTDSSLSNVEFYRNEELVQDEPNGEMIIAAVSKSDEGFFKCKYAGEESPQSWMAVTLSPPSVSGSPPPSVSGSPPPSVSVPVEQSSPVGLMVGLVVVILLTILLILLCRYRTSKDPCCVRPAQTQGTNHGSASDQRTNQSGAPDDVYCPLQHANTSVYGVIQHDDDYENDPDYVRPIPYQETNEGSAADHGTNQTRAPDDLYCPLQHGNTSVYEELKRSDDDYENDGMGAELSE